MFIVICLLAGILCALFLPYTFSVSASKYIAIGILAGLDSVFGGIAASLNNNFKMKIFITGFFGNSIIAAALTYVGHLLNVDIAIAAIVVFGTRIFQNFAIIRRFLIEKHMSKKESKNL